MAKKGGSKQRAQALKNLAKARSARSQKRATSARSGVANRRQRLGKKSFPGANPDLMS